MDLGLLVRSGRVPMIDGFFRADGTVREVLYDGPQLTRFRLGPLFVPASTDDADTSVKIDWADRVSLGDQSGSVCCGDGPLGADGFFARLDSAGVPVWVVFLANSNPFLQARVNGRRATFTNNLDRSITIDLDQPHYTTP